MICTCTVMSFCVFLFFKQKTAYAMRISDWSSDVCSSDLLAIVGRDEQCVGVFPGHAALRLRQGEAAGDEASRRAIPFADDVGVGAAGAQRDEAAPIIGREAVGTVPDPSMLLCLAARLDGDQRRPDDDGQGAVWERVGQD